jgi:hypothetical protein
VYIHVTDQASHVREATELKRLYVRTDAGTDLAACLGELGTVAPDGTHVWLHIATLRAAAAATITDDGEAWNAGFDGMVAYAAENGWTKDDGTQIRAHVEAG